MSKETPKIIARFLQDSQRQWKAPLASQESPWNHAIDLDEAARILGINSKSNRSADAKRSPVTNKPVHAAAASPAAAAAKGAAGPAAASAANNGNRSSLAALSATNRSGTRHLSQIDEHSSSTSEKPTQQPGCG